MSNPIITDEMIRRSIKRYEKQESKDTIYQASMKFYEARLANNGKKVFFAVLKDTPCLNPVNSGVCWTFDEGTILVQHKNMCVNCNKSLSTYRRKLQLSACVGGALKTLMHLCKNAALEVNES